MAAWHLSPCWLLACRGNQLVNWLAGPSLVCLPACSAGSADAPVCRGLVQHGSAAQATGLCMGGWVGGSLLHKQ